jgi:hypothetical protein
MGMSLEKKNKIRSIILHMFVALLALIAMLAVAFKLYTSNYYRQDDVALSEISSVLEEQVKTIENKDGMAFVPQKQEIRAVIVFYPGGRVEYTAYSGLMFRLASRGFICLLPRMPENLALLSVDAVDRLKAENPEHQEYIEGLDWYLAGHSLGGVAASKYLYEAKVAEQDKQQDSAEAHGIGKFKGLILCASYPTDDLKGSGLRLLSIIGSNDTVVKEAGYEAGRNYWPEDSTEYVIQGGIHSYFGNYGIQKGDGVPEITADQQLDETADVIEKWIDGESIG